MTNCEHDITEPTDEMCAHCGKWNQVCIECGKLIDHETGEAI